MHTPERVPIRLAAFTFDPLREEPDLPEQSRVEKAPDDPAHYIIQFRKSLTREERARVQGRYRLTLTDYIPELAYLERLSPQTLDALTKDPLFRAAVPFRPAFKISADIGTLPSRAEARRDVGGLLLNATLFPDADPRLVAAMLTERGATGVRVLDNRGLGGPAQVRLTLGSADLLPRVAEVGDVRWIEEVPERKEDNVNTAGTLQSGTPGTQGIWAQGLHGEGQIIGMIDSAPLDIAHCFFNDPANTPGPAHRKVLAIRNTSGTAAGGHATFVAGCAAGDDIGNPGAHNRRGGAWAARLVSGNTADLGAATVLEELSAAAAAGAFIHTNSWHDDTAGSGNPATYNQTASDVDTFTWNNEDHLVLGSAGNTGEEQGPPGTAKNAICVAASQADPNEMNLGDGNAGPTADGRRKPDLVAPGCGIQSATVSTACGTGPRAACATSYATPHAAAAAALVRQYFTEGYYPTGTPQPHHGFTPSGALLKTMLINATIDMTGVAGYPGTGEGWGLIQLQNALSFPGSARDLRVWDARNLEGLFTGDVRTHHVDVAANTQALRVTLVWTEPPASAGNANPVVNDLDLEVVSPDGTQTFRGNVFAGGVSTTGGAADNLNNVEMVLVNTPAPGDWTVRVTGTQVNVGNPGQGYALTVTGALTDAPVSVGVQDTLVVRVKFADVAFDPSFPNLQNRMIEAADYVDRVSYGQTTVVPAFRGPLTLDHNKDYYYHPERNLLIELTEEVVAKLVTVEPNLFTTFERMIIVTNDVDFTGDWATTGPWPYQLPAGFTRPISVSIQSYANPVARITHGLLHQFGLVDLYAHEGVSFPRPYVDEWDNMAGLYNNVHPLVWSKERAGWLTAHGDTIQYIPRPAPGASYAGLNPIPLFRNTSAVANRKAIAIGLSQSAATLTAENAFYFVEARNNAANYDSGLPGSGVLIYYVNELIPQGEGPVILRDRNLMTPGLNDAFFTVGDVVTIPGTGITITVQAGTPDGAPFNIRVDYTAPVTDYNVFITRGETIGGRFYSWFSPDIWIDSPKNGFNLGGGPPPHDQREHPVAGLMNRIYARVHNAGPATAFDFDVRFRISEPYHTVGGEADFDTFVGIKHIPSLAPGQTDVFVEWTPETGGVPHVCVKVDLINLVGTDTNEHDNWAQENLDVVASVTSSPFPPVTSSYNLTNPYAQAALFYFRAEGAPDGWTVDLVPRKVRLNPGERMTGTATITPPEGAEVCTSERIEITSWTPRGDTLINLGGAVVQIDLRRPTAVKLEADVGRCGDQDWEILLREAKKQGARLDPDVVRKRCGRLVVHGCLVPPQAGVEIILKYVDPLGKVTYRTVKTDENGCFEDLFVSVTGGTWQVSAEYPGGKCEAPHVEGPITVCWCRQ
ncbi:MAG: S8 family serine peptidase [Gemmatimonadales bacterium]|nr:S8 family serine peptidase [Gemmatimonadales bacterium]